jgi:hypothetical protein
MKTVIIIGGGISGLICSYIFKQQADVRVCVLEPGVVGGEFLSGGLKYIHRTDGMKALFDDLDIAYSEYAVKGGIMLRGNVLPYPGCFQGMPRAEIERIQSDHYRKTRRTEPGVHSRQAMNEPASTKPRSALRVDLQELIKTLSGKAAIYKERVIKIDSGAVYTANRRFFKYDYLVVTIPLWVLRDLVSWYVPHGMAMKLNITQVQPRTDKYAPWDYVYTPYTPANAVHRFSPHDSGYAVEVNGELDMLSLESDLNFIFNRGWYTQEITTGLKGHLLPLEQQPQWPSNVAPLGRFAQWDSRATADAVLDRAYKLRQEWFGAKR